MPLLFSIICFVFSNICLYIYSILSRDSTLSGWKILLIPLIFFPIIYIANILFSSAWILANKTNISTAIIGIINLAIGIIIFMLGHAIYYKQNFSFPMIFGSILVILGAILINQ